MIRSALLLSFLLAFLPSLDARADDDASTTVLPETARSLEMQPIGAVEATTLETWRGENGLLVIFASNTCPYVLDWSDRFARLAEQGRERSIGIVAINSNARRRDSTDSPEAMAEFADAHLGEIPYLVDEGSKLADLLGAARTPEAFLYDADLRLVYQGLIDDHSGPFDEVEHHFLRDALEAVVGEGTMPESTAPLGCAVQRPRRSRR